MRYEELSAVCIHFHTSYKMYPIAFNETFGIDNGGLEVYLVGGSAVVSTL